jgi:hypothetical protein
MISETIQGIVGTGLTGATGWAIKALHNLSTRVAVLEKGQVDFLPLLDSKLDRVIVYCDQLEKRVERIERSMNGHLQRD